MVGRDQNTRTYVLPKAQVVSTQSAAILRLSRVLQFCWHYCQYLLHLSRNSQSIARQHRTASLSEHTEVHLLANGISHVLKS